MFCFIDYRTTKIERENLQRLDFNCIEIPKCKNLYPAIDGHVDIQLNILNIKSKEVIIHKDIDESFKLNLLKQGISYIETNNSLSPKYPNDVLINALILDNYFIHNLKFTDSNLLKTQDNKIKIHVKQGYTNCSCLPINEKALITNDTSIYKELTKNDFDVLLLPPGDISLPGLNYGFIGGTGGMISKNTIAFFGSLDNYLYGEKVKSFLYKYDVYPIYLSEGKLNDRGSLLIL